MGRQVFIAHRRDDFNTHVAALCNELKRELSGVQLYVDRKDVPPGADWERALADAILSSCAVVWVIASKDGLDRLGQTSDFLRRELLVALTKGTPVLPVIIGDVGYPDQENLPAELSRLVRLQFVRLSGETREANLRRLAARINLLAGTLDNRWLRTTAQRWILGAVTVFASVGAAFPVARMLSEYVATAGLGTRSLPARSNETHLGAEQSERGGGAPGLRGVQAEGRSLLNVNEVSLQSFGGSAQSSAKTTSDWSEKAKQTPPPRGIDSPPGVTFRYSEHSPGNNSGARIETSHLNVPSVMPPMSRNQVVGLVDDAQNLLDQRQYLEAATRAEIVEKLNLGRAELDLQRRASDIRRRACVDGALPCAREKQ